MNLFKVSTYTHTHTYGYSLLHIWVVFNKCTWAICCNVKRNAEREVANTLIVNDTTLHTILLSSIHRHNNHMEGYVLAHRNGSGNKLEGARGCLSGIRSSRRDTKSRSAKRDCIERTNGLRQRTDFTRTYMSSNDIHLHAILAHH